MTAAPHTNRLIHETSPYLQQHAHNPVDWHPWGEEALARAWVIPDRRMAPKLLRSTFLRWTFLRWICFRSTHGKRKENNIHNQQHRMESHGTRTKD